MTLIGPSFLPFLVAMTVLTLAPGPDTFLVIRNTLKRGAREGCITSLGICVGLFVHAILSACGISLILVQSATLFHTVKLIGAGYLIWLGAKSLLEARNAPLSIEETQAGGPFASGSGQSFREGILSNVLNPKTAVFYMAFLPQFIRPSDPVFVKSLFLAACHFVIALLWLCFLSRFLEEVRHIFLHPTTSRFLEGLSGIFLILFGIALGLAGQEQIPHNETQLLNSPGR